MIIKKVLKTIYFEWRDENQTLYLSTPTITKRNFFPLLRFMTRIEQRMWGRKLDRLLKKLDNITQ